MKKVLYISIRYDNDLLSLSAYEGPNKKRRTIKHYKDLPLSHSDISEINSDCHKLFDILNNAGRRAEVDRDIIERAKYTGQSLFDRLLTQDVKKLLYNANCRDLILEIDGTLVQIPWELLHDGSDFLCQRFNMGRMVDTKQAYEPYVHREVEKKPFKMLILADPQGDLNAAYEEGDILSKKFKDFQEHGDCRQQVELTLKTSSIKTEYIKKSLREFDIIHYAGHARYDVNHPSQSSWQTADGDLLAGDIVKMIGGVPLPFLIFSNACQSGQTDPWCLTANSENDIYGLANAFLLAGAQHYIGTFWDIPDRQGLRLAVEFYKNLLKGIHIGAAIREARLHLIQRFGEESITWMAYMLYGDPTDVYFDQDDLLPVNSGHLGNEEPSTHHEDVDPLTSGEMRGKGSIAIEKDKVESISQPSSFLFWFIHSLKAALYLLLLDLLLLVLILVGIYEFRELFLCHGDEPKTRIDIMIEDLEKRMKDGKIKQAFYPEDEWSSRPLTMAVFGYLSIKDPDPNATIKLRMCNNRFARQMTAAIHQNQKIISLVNRRHLDEFLKEHKLFLSDLADRKKDLIRIGNLLGARLIVFSETVPAVPADQKPVICGKLPKKSISTLPSIVWLLYCYDI